MARPEHYIADKYDFKDREWPDEPPPEPQATDPHENGEVVQEQIAIDRRYLALMTQVLDIEALRKITPPVSLVEGYLYQNTLAWLGGKPGHAKSFVAVELACCVSTGTAWHGHDVVQGPVLYLIAEGAAGIAQRVDAWELAHGRAGNVMFLPVPVQMMESIDAAAFAQLLGDLQPSLVILDTQARVTVGADENSSRDMGQFVDALEELRRQSGACILVVHHEPRNGENLRGSTALEGAATTIMRVSKDGTMVELSNPKQKDALAQGPIQLALTPIGGSAILSHEAVGLMINKTESEHQILAVLRDSFGTRGANKTELKEAANLSKSTWHRSINALVGKGLVLESKAGRSTIYTLPVADEQPEIPISPTESQDPP
jgi:predicted transcriptional regulator